VSVDNEPKQRLNRNKNRRGKRGKEKVKKNKVTQEER
jgi:hypothetical protein